MWTIFKKTELAAQLEKRAKERHEEDGRGGVVPKPVVEPSEVVAEPSDAAVAPEVTAAAKGLNDNAHGIDRFGYRVSYPFCSSFSIAPRAGRPLPTL